VREAWTTGSSWAGNSGEVGNGESRPPVRGDLDTHGVISTGAVGLCGATTFTIVHDYQVSYTEISRSRHTRDG
jgi:hypothetical protein